jgi:hypothetical protein
MPSKKVKIRAFLDDSGTIDFDIDGIKPQQARLKLDKGSGQHDIGFMLQDHTGKGLQFDTSDPIWVDEDAPCPPTPGVTTDQLAVTGCTGNTLSTSNANEGRARELRYQLNFIASDGSRQACDPIIDNGGGTKN